MPGKVNPSVPEMVNQVCQQVWGCDAAVLAASAAGQLELNVMMPVIAWNTLHASAILANAMKVLTERAVDWDKAREMEEQADEPWRTPNMRHPDMLLTAENGWLGEFGHGPDKKAELRRLFDEWRASEGLEAIEWGEEV